MTKRFAFGLGLRGKLIVTVVTGVLLGFAIIGSYRLYQAKLDLMNDIRNSGQERATLIAEAMANLVVGYDYSNMESLADRIVTLQDVNRITVLNHAGKTMVSRARQGGSNAPFLRFEAPITFSGQRVGTVELLISLERLKAMTDITYRNIILVLIFFATCLSFLIYQTTSRAIIKPIGHIRDLMKSILDNPGGGAPRQIEFMGKDDIGELTGIFNSMNAKVYEYQQRLQEKYDRADSALMATNEQLKARTLELEQAIALVERMATTDSLTDMPNRRHFDDCLATAFARAARFNEPLCLILLDVDFFKQINDQYGHAAGDYVLQELARLIKSRTRETDVCARLGGDEFAILLYHAGIDDARMMADDLAGSVRQHLFAVSGIRLAVTLSMGVAQLKEGMDIETFCASADKALYEAKRRGRNQAAIYPFEAFLTG